MQVSDFIEKYFILELYRWVSARKPGVKMLLWVVLQCPRQPLDYVLICGFSGREATEVIPGFCHAPRRHWLVLASPVRSGLCDLFSRTGLLDASGSGPSAKNRWDRTSDPGLESGRVRDSSGC